MDTLSLQLLLQTYHENVMFLQVDDTQRVVLIQLETRKFITIRWYDARQCAIIKLTPEGRQFVIKLCGAATALLKL